MQCIRLVAGISLREHAERINYFCNGISFLSETLCVNASATSLSYNDVKRSVKAQVAT